MAKPLLHFSGYKRYFFLIIVLGFTNWIVSASPKYLFTDSTQVKIVKCYPNPATSFINFDLPKTVDKSFVLQVYSFAGKQMTEIVVTSNKIVLSLNNFYRGIYVFQLRDKTGTIVDSGKFQVIK